MGFERHVTGKIWFSRLYFYSTIKPKACSVEFVIQYTKKPKLETAASGALITDKISLAQTHLLASNK